MRIVGGAHKGARIAAPGSLDVRPTTDRTREAVFNILAHGIEDFALEGARVLDAFAGTGALGLEALSRGAAFCLFIEQASAARGTIRRNIETLGLTGHTKLWRRDATRLGSCETLAPFDLMFADPPYGKGFGEAAIGSALAGGWLADNAVIVLEESVKAEIAAPQGLAALDKRRYGDTEIHMFRKV